MILSLFQIVLKEIKVIVTSFCPEIDVYDYDEGSESCNDAESIRMVK